MAGTGRKGKYKGICRWLLFRQYDLRHLWIIDSIPSNLSFTTLIVENKEIRFDKSPERESQYEKSGCNHKLMQQEQIEWAFTSAAMGGRSTV